MDADPNNVIELGIDEKRELVEKKATCPFIGSALAQGKLVIRNDARNPLASIEDVRNLGNSGGGDLGDLLAVFAAGNHAFMLGPTGKLDREVPNGSFSLEFPGSQGSHKGHSGILQGDPEIPGSGRLSETDFARFASRANGGWIKRSEVGSFIAENLLKDPQSKVFGNNVATLLAGDLLAFVETIGPAWMQKLFGSDEDASTAHRDLPELRDLKAMFLEKRLPDGWETWKKSRPDWMKHTISLLLSAGKTYWAPHAATLTELSAVLVSARLG